MSIADHLSVLKNDPVVSSSVAALKNQLHKLTSDIVGIAAPKAESQITYSEAISACEEYRGGKLYYPYLSSGRGSGPFVELADGSVKLDMICGIGVHGLGHSHPTLTEAGIYASMLDTVMQGNLQTSIQSLGLPKLLLDLANEKVRNFDHCVLSTSGAMANENALKIAFQNRFPANRIIAFEHSFAGRTIALSQVTDKAAYRVGIPESVHVDFVSFYREGALEESIQKTKQELELLFQRYPGKHAVFMMELIQGEGGYNVGHPEYFRAVIEFIKSHGVLVFFDEIQSFARTSRPFAFQHFGLEGLGDLVSVGKITQACATLFTGKVKPKPGLISQTFTGGTWELLAGETILRHLIDNGAFGANGRNMQIFEEFREAIAPFQKRHPKLIKGPFGVGAMIAFTPLHGMPDEVNLVGQRLFEAGVIGFIAGSAPARIRFLPPLGIVTKEQIQLCCDQLARTLLPFAPQ